MFVHPHVTGMSDYYFVMILDHSSSHFEVMHFSMKLNLLIKHFSLSVPHSKSGVVPMSSLLGIGQLSFWEVGKGGTIG
jgi:hypothetical protein